MFKKYFFVLCLFCLKLSLFGQNYEFKKKFSPSDRKEFLGLTKKMFEISNDASYNLSSFDAQAKFSDICDATRYNDAYLQKLKTKFSKDSLNPFTLNDYGNYYLNKGNNSLAKKYFKKSLDNLSLKALKGKDSAYYYSFRGILKSNLETEGAINDIEKALKINPNDSIAMAFYPMFLIQQDRFLDSEKICIDALEKKSGSPLMPFTFLSMNFLFENFRENLDPSKKDANSKKDYDELINLKTVYKYANLYKNDTQIQNITKMAEILSLFIKMNQFETNENNEILFKFSEKEIKKINQLDREFKELLAKGKINPFTGNKSLAVLNFMLGNKDKAIDYVKKAIAVFPESKRTNQFNTNESYDLLLTLYQEKKDNINFKKTLEEKILKSSEDQKSIKDYISAASFYLYENNLTLSEEWCNKAREIDSDSFEALRLLAHLKFLNNQNTLGQFYLDQASNQMKDDSDSYILGLQVTLYMILNSDNNNAKVAFDNIEACRKISQKECEICDELIEKYIQINP